MEKSYPFTLLPRYPGAREYPYCVTLLPQCYPYTLGVFTSTGVTGYTGIKVTFCNAFKWRKFTLLPCYRVTPVLVNTPFVLPYYPKVTLLPQCYPYTLGAFTSTRVTGYKGMRVTFCNAFKWREVTLIPLYPVTPVLVNTLIVLPYHPKVTLLPQCYPYTLGVFTRTGVTGYKGIRVTFCNVFKWRKVTLIPLYPVTLVVVNTPNV